MIPLAACLLPPPVTVVKAYMSWLLRDEGQGWKFTVLSFYLCLRVSAVKQRRMAIIVPLKDMSTSIRLSVALSAAGGTHINYLLLLVLSLLICHW